MGSDHDLLSIFGHAQAAQTSNMLQDRGRAQRHATPRTHNTLESWIHSIAFMGYSAAAVSRTRHFRLSCNWFRATNFCRYPETLYRGKWQGSQHHRLSANVNNICCTENSR